MAAGIVNSGWQKGFPADHTVSEQCHKLHTASLKIQGSS